MTEYLSMLSALAQETRLEVFRLLVVHGPEGLAAGEIAQRLSVPSNTLSTHLRILDNSGLLRSERRSRSIVYTVDLEAMRALVMFLLEDCCRGDADMCAPILKALMERCDCEEAAGRPRADA